MANYGWRHVVRRYGMYSPLEYRDIKTEAVLKVVQRTGVRQNDAEALRWFRRGAAAGDGRAMANLGIMYEVGKGVEQDDAEAVRWYRRGADAGYGRAMANLAVMHLAGRGELKPDDEAAAGWLQAAAKLGDGRAMTHLALLHFQGRGVPQSDALGLRWLQSARRNGDYAAYYYLGVLHAAGGAGLKKNLLEARGELRNMLGLAGCSAGNVPRPSCIRSDELGISVGDIGTGSPISLYEAANRQYLALGREMGLDVPGWTEAEARGALVLVLILASLVGSGTDSARPPRDHLKESLEKNQRDLECRLSGGTPLGDYCDRK